MERQRGTRGDAQHSAIFIYISAVQRVQQDYPLRPVWRTADEALREMSRRFAGMHAKTGRPSVALEKLLRALLLQALYSVWSERC
ncbi:MAG: hypothetical protein ACRD27_01915 [Terracidiphilus sp.]